MSLYDFHQATKISRMDLSMDMIIMAAMLKADFPTLFKLAAVFPEIWIEVHDRNDAADGVLPGDEEEALT